MVGRCLTRLVNHSQVVGDKTPGVGVGGFLTRLVQHLLGGMGG